MVELVFRNCYPTFLTYAHHPIHADDRMMNSDLDFPVAFSFGDRDFLGSEGADEIVRNNKYFKSGESQLFKLKNSGHNLFLDNPEELCN